MLEYLQTQHNDSGNIMERFAEEQNIRLEKVLDGNIYVSFADFKTRYNPCNSNGL
jgi:hypothetical protein